MSFVVYEHPLNERARLLMRLELLFSQLTDYQSLDQQQNIQPFFTRLYDCIELLERNDVRGTLAFYLDQFEKSMLRWASHPDIANDSLQEKLREAVRLQSEVNNMTKACQQLKDDKFLASLRQRFGIAGGACDFDLPQLHYWRNKPLQERQDDISEWLLALKPLQQALDFALLFLRESGGFESKQAPNGFYQDSCEDSVSLLRIRYDASFGCFPMISGSHRRYSISFMRPDKCSVKTSVSDTISFELANC